MLPNFLHLVGKFEVILCNGSWTLYDIKPLFANVGQKTELAEVKSLLKDTPSVHVYSVQRSLPQDPAQLWSADFVQSEELFNEPSESNNSLRDNRYGRIGSSTQCKFTLNHVDKKIQHFLTQIVMILFT
jgi:hypothetical protein